MSSQFVVRYGAMRTLGEFAARESNTYPRGTQVVIRSDRGLEIGEVLSAAGARTDELLPDAPHGEILRAATAEDEAESGRLHQGERAEFETAERCIRERNMPMQLVDVEHLFGGERIVFYYQAEKRVDFRDLVKDLAREFKTRIEMRQIGARDEAKLLADYGDCGKPVCCNTHLATMPPVSMRMAKLQKATLDPSKISGRCGRLKCCLRFEFAHYEATYETLPPVGADVETRIGHGRVIAQEILAQRLLVEFDDRRRVLVSRQDVLVPTPPSELAERAEQWAAHEGCGSCGSPGGCESGGCESGGCGQGGCGGCEGR